MDWFGDGKKKKLVVAGSLSHTFVQTVAKESWYTVSYEQIFDSKVRCGPQHPASNLNFLTTLNCYNPCVSKLFRFSFVRQELFTFNKHFKGLY